MKRIVVVAAVGLWLAWTGTVGAADWPQWQGPTRDSKSPDTGLLKSWPEGGPKLLWKTSGLGTGYSGVAVARDKIYITGLVGGNLVLFALDMDGKEKWKAEVGPEFMQNRQGSRATSAIDGDRLYIMTGMALVACYNADTGEKLWSVDALREFGGTLPPWGYGESVFIYNDLAIVKPGGNQCIVALDKKTGKKVWASSGFTASAHHGSCIAVTYEGVPMIIAGTGDGIFAVDAKDGRMLWSDEWCKGNTANCPTPAYADGYVFWANGYRKGGVCLKLSVEGGKVTATRAWTTADMDCQHGGYIIHEGYVYGNNGRGWACLDLKTGERKWAAPGVGKGSLCFADGMLYLFGENGGLAALAEATPAGLTLKGQVRVAGQGTSWAHPVVIGGRLYLRYSDTLYCFDVKAQ